MTGILIALLSGVLMSLQGVFNTEVTKGSSLWVSACWVQFSALLTCLLFWIVSDGSAFRILGQIRPRYLLLGGVLGAFITCTVIRSMSSLGPAKAVLLIVTAQLLAAYLIELLGWFGVEKVPFSFRKLAGLALAVVGIILFKWE